jgi:hypothetical protein
MARNDRAPCSTFVGLILFAVAIVLAFTFGSPTPLLNRIILGAFSLGGGAIATEISGMIKVDLQSGAANSNWCDRRSCNLHDPVSCFARVRLAVCFRRSLTI